ncbi:hypothetical protein [Streptomyces sp. NPDC056227]|uniref:hypothetical protein n=1 Tax=Streptomyces sp. NPDC056227 TaxID=3345753 RepID=UPI0035DF2752
MGGAGAAQAAHRSKRSLRGVRSPKFDKRAVATRYDKLAVRYEATLHIACINEWL